MTTFSAQGSVEHSRIGPMFEQRSRMIDWRERKAIIRDVLREVASIFDEYPQALTLSERAEELDKEVNPQCECPSDHKGDSHVAPCAMAGCYWWEPI